MQARGAVSILLLLREDADDAKRRALQRHAVGLFGIALAVGEAAHAAHGLLLERPVAQGGVIEGGSRRNGYRIQGAECKKNGQ